MINVEVKLDKKRATNKVYFDKMLKKFSDKVKASEILEEIRLKRNYLKPSAFRKEKKQRQHLKWKFYK